MKKRTEKIIASIFILILFAVAIAFLMQNKKNVCGDETLDKTCSSRKPYFCLNGVLVETASVCGCSNLSEVNGDKCISEYQNDSKEVTLNYVIDGKEGEINFTVYEGAYDYIAGIPRYLDSTDKEPTLLDFKLKSIDDPLQKEFLLPLVTEIQNIDSDKDDQARIAISIIQNIPFGDSNKTYKIGNFETPYYRYPYEVLYENEGVCGEKSELLAFLLREIGYGTSFLYYAEENHEAIGIKCPVKKSLHNSGYCFIETTGPSIITDYKTDYVVIGKLRSVPEITPIQGDMSFGENGFYEYGDAKTLDKIRDSIKEDGLTTPLQHWQLQNLREKYGLVI